MKAVKKGKDGRLYFGKGTKGGLAPQPVQAGVNISSISIPGVYSTTDNYAAPLVGGKYTYLDLFNNGFTREEINTIESASPAGSRPKYTAQGLLMKQLQERKYGDEIYNRYSAAHTVHVAMGEAIKKALPLPENPSDRFMALKDVSPLYGRLLSEVVGTRRNYNGSKMDDDNSLYSTGFLQFAQKLHDRYRGGDFAALQTGDDGKLYISHDAHDFLAAYKRELESNSYAKEHVDRDLNYFSEAARKYNNGEAGVQGDNAYYNVAKVKPSEALVAARIEAAYAQKELYKEEAKTSKGFGALLRGGRKAKSVVEAEKSLSEKIRLRDSLENR